jgi:hypothetical protein
MPMARSLEGKGIVEGRDVPMKIVLRKSAQIAGRVEIVEVGGDPDKVPSKRTFGSEEEAVHAVAQYLGQLTEEFDEIAYQD